jgi:hypothetical protein
MPIKQPETIMTNGAFWNGFLKKAETYVAPAPGAVAGTAERALLWNEQGGVDPRTPEDMQAAGAARLITLPKEVEGSSCLSCVHFRQLDPELGSGFCTNPGLKIDVTARMVCSLWENPGSLDPAKAQAEAEAVAQEEQMGAAQDSEAIMQDLQGGQSGQPGQEAVPGQDPAAAGGQPGELTPPPGGAPSGPAAAGEGGEAKPKPKKDKENKESGKDSGSKHTINISVGGGGAKKTAAEHVKEAFNIHMALKRLGKYKKGSTVTSRLAKR